MVRVPQPTRGTPHVSPEVEARALSTRRVRSFGVLRIAAGETAKLVEANPDRALVMLATTQAVHQWDITFRPEKAPVSADDGFRVAEGDNNATTSPVGLSRMPLHLFGTEEWWVLINDLPLLGGISWVEYDR